VNVEHLRAFLWLRWRLLVHQLRRAGLVNAVFLAILAVLGTLFGIGLFVGFLLLGLFVLPEASPTVMLFVWDGLVLAFLFCWCIGLITELQRSELLSLEKFLHLPVSPAGAFVINYLSSLLSINLLLFVPPMIGLSVALACARGPAMLLLLPLLAAFLLVVTALTYQFQGWLATLMANPRRRRAVIVAVTLGFIVICQLPNLINFLGPWKEPRQDPLAAATNTKEARLRQTLAAGKITPAEYERQLHEVREQYQAQEQERERQALERVGHSAELINLVLPPGWLPLGAMGLARGQVLPALLGTLGLGLLGTASLWRAYRTTVRLYTGQFSGGKKRRRAAAAAAPEAVKPSARLLERSIPGVSEHASAVAAAGVRSLLRAPEAKLMLLGPVILVLLLGLMLWNRPGEVPIGLRPLALFGVVAMIFLSLNQVAANQFGFDRGGFRVFVLCPAPRRDVLLGKNLALAPVALGLGLVVAVGMELAYPMRLADFLAVLPQVLSMYLLFCLLANCASILAPVALGQGSLKAVNPSVIPILLQVAMLFVVGPVLAPTLLPLGVALALEEQGWLPALVVGPLLSLAECVAIVYLYRFVLRWQGVWLQAREQQILKVVASKAE
jgi:hypothetical protein